MGANTMQENVILFSGSGFLTFFYYCLDYLSIKDAQILSLSIVFLLSSIIGFFRSLSLRLSMRQFLLMECITKTCLFFIPIILAVGALQVPVLNYFVDYIFSLLILGEIFSILVSIQSIRTRKLIDDLDLYNFFILKFKEFIYKHLDLKRMNEAGANKFDEWIFKNQTLEKKDPQENANDSLPKSTQDSDKNHK